MALQQYLNHYFQPGAQSTGIDRTSEAFKRFSEHIHLLVQYPGMDFEALRLLTELRTHEEHGRSKPQQSLSADSLFLDQLTESSKEFFPTHMLRQGGQQVREAVPPPQWATAADFFLGPTPPQPFSNPPNMTPMTPMVGYPGHFTSSPEMFYGFPPHQSMMFNPYTHHHQHPHPMMGFMPAVPAGYPSVMMQPCGANKKAMPSSSMKRVGLKRQLDETASESSNSDDSAIHALVSAVDQEQRQSPSHLVEQRPSAEEAAASTMLNMARQVKESTTPPSTPPSPISPETATPPKRRRTHRVEEETTSSQRRQHMGDTGPQQTTTTGKVCQLERCQDAALSNGLCELHGGHQQCKMNGCVNPEVHCGFCLSHLKHERRCQYKDCRRRDEGKGACIRHGGTRSCNYDGCSKRPLKFGFCVTHGGGRKCKIDACSKVDKGGGFCISHGGGRRCRRDGCVKLDAGRGFCIGHGGGRRCSHAGCQKGAQKGGRCISHGGGKRCRLRECGKPDSGNGYCEAHLSLQK